MQINLKGKNLELTEAIDDYVLRRVSNLGKLLSKMEDGGERSIMVDFEVAKTTNHHKAGEVYEAACKVNIGGREFYSSSEKEDLYEAVDDVKAKLFGEISKNKDRRQTLFHRGARSVKKMLKGLSRRNPFTSRYDKE